ncbi:Mitochondrial small ribosomal subunit Rsm22-like protein [Elsinoe fawcettii]|nr:Mitochondrial small ribosomal subunit Rsm22-like protein [Elsinoe fawcettii]
MYGDRLPEGLLDAAQYKSFERMFGAPDLVSSTEVQEELSAAEEAALSSGTGVLRKSPDGSLEEVEYLPEAEELDSDGPESLEAALNSPEMLRLRKSKKGKFFMHAKKKELDDTFLYAEMTRADEAALAHLEKEWKSMDEDEHIMYLDDVRYFKLEQYLRTNDRDEEADELLQCLFLHYEAKVEAEAKKREQAASEEAVPEEMVDEEPDTSEAPELEGDSIQRTHPFTQANRFTTFPATVQLPQAALVGPVSAFISGTSPVHLADAARRIFGGDGLPYSTSNPSFAKSMPQKAIPLDPSLERMSDIEADAYFAAVTPGTYASVTSALVESRKRLGSSWLENLLQKKGGPRILDAGSAGAGVIAFRSMLRAEWERLHDNCEDPEALKGLATVDGRAGGAPLEPPTGKATVLTSSDAMRQRASLLLDNTTFIPRLPDYIHASNSSAAQHGKFDVIIAPHTLWPLKEEYLRKQHIANLWSLLHADGGLLLLVEKGVPRGFEMVAGARKFLLDTRIASPGNETVAEEVTEPGEGHVFGIRDKGKGMIIAPCTNHAGCPMYTKPGMSAGRKDYCHFEQRYTRPPYLQKLLRAKDKNHEDVQFSYLSIMRGRDLRDRDEEAVVQGDLATSRAFEGYEHMQPQEVVEAEFDPTAPALDESPAVRTAPHGLMLPRAVFPPLKRTGHVILDLCTPSGTLERWTVPRSFSKQAFRDARKSQWGDLWALGAKTRVAREVRLGKDGKTKPHTINLKAVTMSAKAKRKMAEQPQKKKRAQSIIYDVPVDGSSGKIQESGIKPLVSGRLRRGKVSGVRDKRDKTGSGRGRKKALADE